MLLWVGRKTELKQWRIEKSKAGFWNSTNRLYLCAVQRKEGEEGEEGEEGGARGKVGGAREDMARLTDLPIESP
jgi:hypothetical protein